MEINDVDSFIGTFNYTSGSGKKTRQLNFLIYTNTKEIKLNSAEHTESYWSDLIDNTFESLNISDETKRIIQVAQSS